jgi:hypothetical protein
MLRTFALAAVITCSVVVAVRPAHLDVVYLPWMQRPTPVTVVSTPCYTCGSGNGPSAGALAARVELAPDEHLVAVNGVITRSTLDEALGGFHHHGEAFDLLLVGPAGLRRVVLVLT